MRNIKKKRLLALLLEPEGKWTKYALAKRAECSHVWVIKFLRDMEKKNLMQGFEVLNPHNLFALFQRLQNKKKKRRSYSISNIQSFLDWMAKSNRDYAFTTFQAENMVQQYLFRHEIEFYVKKEDVEEWHGELAGKGLYGGGNVTIIVEEYDELFNKKKSGKWWRVNIPQLISDLYEKGSSATEAGEMLFEKMVKMMKK